MKKAILLLALTAVIAALMTGCNLSRDEAETTTPCETDRETEAETQYCEETTAEIGHIDGDADGYTREEYEKVSFSKPAGFYGEAFTLDLGAPKGYSIYYTLDGSDPIENGIPYESGILLSDTSDKPWGETIKAGIRMVGGTPSYAGLPGGYSVRAYATDGTNTTQITTNTYFILPGFDGLGVTVMNMSIDVDDFIGPENGAYYTYQFFIWETRPRSVGYLEVFDGKGNRVGNSYMDFAVSGNGSSGINMKSLRMYYKKSLNEQTGNPTTLEYNLFDGYALDKWQLPIESFSRILIRNSGNDYGDSYIRDAFCQRLALGTNVDSMASSDVLFFVNGELWGLYNVRERYSQEYFESHYGVDKDNVVMVENVSPLAHENPSLGYNTDYVLSQGEEGDEQAWLDLFDYIYNNDPSNNKVYRYIEERFDIDSYIDYWIFNVYLGNNDWPGNNIKVWRNKNPDDPSGMDTKWRYVLLDMDFCLGLGSSITDNLFGSANRSTKNGAIMYQLHKNEEFRQKFAKRAYYLVKNVLAPEHSIPVLENIADSKRQYLSLQYARWGGNIGTFNNAIQTIKYFLNNREPYFMKYLCAFTGVTEEWMAENSDYAMKLSFQPEKVSLTLNGEKLNRNGQTVAIPIDNTKVKISATACEGCKIKSIEFISDDGTSSVYDGKASELLIQSSGTLYIHTEAEKQ